MKLKVKISKEELRKVEKKLNDGVEIKFLEVAWRRFFDDCAAIRPRAMRMVHACPVVREITAGMRQHNLQPGITVHHAVEY